MAVQTTLVAPTTDAEPTPLISIPHGFHFKAQDRRLRPHPASPINHDTPPPPLGVLENFVGNFTGTGLNLIFRPNSGQTTFENPLPGPPAPTPPNENVLEINLTAEVVTFSPALGDVPNRGLERQPDISLNGVPYVQVVSDVSNSVTGKGDAPPSGIHFEPGLWMHVPATTIDPVLPESLTRMASIPHGTTINAQCLAPSTSIPGPPPFTGPNALPKVDITPFVIGNPNQKVRFASQTATATNTPRLPQDLTTFIAAGTVTQDILDNPNLVLANAIRGQNIKNTVVFTVSTNPTAPFLAGGTANIDFLQGSSAGAQSGPNASATQMTATFWIETVQHDLPVPVFKHGDPPLLIQVPPAHPGAQPGPTFKVHPPRDVPNPRLVSVDSTQIQYMQTVFLNFAGLTWPHVSCATLVPSQPIRVSPDVFN